MFTLQTHVHQVLLYIWHYIAHTCRLGHHYNILLNSVNDLLLYSNTPRLHAHNWDKGKTAPFLSFYSFKNALAKTLVCCAVRERYIMCINRCTLVSRSLPFQIKYSSLCHYTTGTKSNPFTWYSPTHTETHSNSTDKFCPIFTQSMRFARCGSAFEYEPCVFHDSRTLDARKTTAPTPCLEGVKISQFQPFAFRLFSGYFPSRAVPVSRVNGFRGYSGPVLAVTCCQRISSLAFLLQTLGSNFPRLASAISQYGAAGRLIDLHASDDIIIHCWRNARCADWHSLCACANPSPTLAVCPSFDDILIQQA